jgi:hypothetical protein
MPEPSNGGDCVPMPHAPVWHPSTTHLALLNSARRLSHTHQHHPGQKALLVVTGEDLDLPRQTLGHAKPGFTFSSTTTTTSLK